MTMCLPYVLSICLLTGKPVEKNPETLQSVERTRGGRHWVDAKTDPPKSPAESLKCFQVAPGLKIELVAAEPLVKDPVAITFDRRGRMFVAEYGDYPIGPPKGQPPLSQVVLLEDVDGDGRSDRRHVFADHLTFAYSLMAFNEGILVGAQTQILFLKDTDGDNKADVRKVLFQGFKPAHPQMQIGNPRWGLDNWIYLNYGSGRIRSAQAGDQAVEMPRLDFRFHPLTLQFGPDSGLGQYGNTFDNWGRRFFCSNRNPIMMSVLPYSVVRRNPFVVIPKAYTDIAPSGGDTRVYPLVEMKSNWLSHAGTHTSACGVTAYRGDLLPSDYHSSVFVCEPVGYLVTRSIVKPKGVLPTAVRARPKTDFLASTDTWFRPASLATGPDGALYLADMYRLYVEHPRFLPEDVAKRLDWRAGDDRGRIYRILPETGTPRTFHPPETTDDLVALLSDANGWRRYLGQRLLVQRQAKDAVPKLEALLRDGNTALARLHALWTLDGLGGLNLGHLRKALHDPSAYVRKDAVSLSAKLLSGQPGLLEELADVCQDSDVRVRFQVALALGETDERGATDLLTRLALRDGSDHWFALAILSSAKERSGAILVGLVKNAKFASHGDPANIDLVRRLATVVGARGDQDELAALLETIVAAEQTDVWWQTAALSGLATGLPRHRGALGRTSLPKLVANPPKRLANSVERIRRLLLRVSHVALDNQLDTGDRVAAVELLGYQPFDQVVGAFKQLLTTGQPIAVQLACLRAMRAGGGEGAASIVLDRWPTLGSSVRGPALDLLLRRTSTTRRALEAMSEGKINPSVISLDRRVLLLRHRDEPIRRLATRLFGGTISANRRQVARQYTSALLLKGSATEGAKIFERICTNCHRMDGQGHEVGPDISDVRNRSREALLYDILDPNRAVNPKYTGYAVVTDDGRVFNGLMVSETADAVILRQPEGKQQVIARTQIEEVRASGMSLMPEGVEKDISVRQMADLLEYLKSRK